MIVSLFIYAFLKLYLIMNIYQQAHYQFKLYCKHFIINFLFYDLFPFLVLIIGIYQPYLSIKIICSVYLFLFGCFYLVARVHLKWTKRILRLLVLSVLYSGIGLIPFVGPYLLLFFEFSILPVFLLERWISYLLNQPYIKRATQKMKGYQGKIIAITGSFGKTSTKNLFLQGLGLFYSVAATEKSYNTPLGISKFINQIPDLNVYDYLIFEFGASHLGDIDKLKKIANPDIVVVTGIGLMHVETFGSLDQIIKEKMSIITGAKIAILNYDCEYIRNYPISHETKVLSYGLYHGDFQVISMEEHSFEVYCHNRLELFQHQFISTHQVLNLLAVISFLNDLNCDINRLKKGVYTFHTVENRLELKTIDHRFVLDDSFNSNYHGFVEALSILKLNQGKRILLTPGMVELGKYKKELFTNLVSYITTSADIVILIGYYQTKIIYKMLKEYNKEVYVVRNFMEGYGLYLEIIKSEKNSMLLIENDVPDLYRVGLI